MKVKEIMTPDPRTCRPEDTLAAAARIMWEADCGCVPVVADGGKVMAMITDRDICMCAMTQGRPLGEIRVAEAMSKDILSCRPEDLLGDAELIMREHQVRRLAVTDANGMPIGILSINDISRKAPTADRPRAPIFEQVAHTLAAIGQPNGKTGRPPVPAGGSAVGASR